MAVNDVGEGTNMVAIRLGSLRRRRGLTQEELALRAGVKQPQISAWEDGRRRPSIENVGKLATGFGMQHEELLRELGMIDGPPNGTTPPRPPDLPAPLVEAMGEMIRRHPGLRPQLEARRGDPDFPGQVADLAHLLGIVIRGWVDDLERPGEGL